MFAAEEAEVAVVGSNSFATIGKAVGRSKAAGQLLEAAEWVVQARAGRDNATRTAVLFAPTTHTRRPRSARYSI